MYSGIHTLLNTIFLGLGAFLAFNTGNWRERPWFAFMLLALFISDAILVFSLVAYRLGYPVSDMMSFDIWAGGRSIGYLVIFAAFWETLDEDAHKRYRILAWCLLAIFILTGVFRQIDLQLTTRALAQQVNLPFVRYFIEVSPYYLPRLPLFVFAALFIFKAFKERHPEKIVITLYATFELAGDLAKIVISDFMHLRIFEFKADPWFRTLLALTAIAALVYRTLRQGIKAPSV